MNSFRVRRSANLFPFVFDHEIEQWRVNRRGGNGQVTPSDVDTACWSEPL